MELWPFDRFSEDMCLFFASLHQRLIKEIPTKHFELTGFEDLTLILRQKFPQPVLAELAALPIEEDCRRIRMLLDKSPTCARYQLSFSDAEEGETPGIIRLYTLSGRTEETLPIVKTWEGRIVSEDFEVQEVVRWGFVLGLAGLVMLRWIAEANPQPGVFCVGVEGRLHLYLGFMEGGLIVPAAEWN